ncbi:MAG: hypothetical protein Q9213_001334 [Squamulea squamosa]
MEQNPGLGVLTTLPPELRNMIWECLSKQHSFTFFRTSRQIYAEGSEIFYHNQILQFHISPKYEYKSWLVGESNFVAECAPQRFVLQDVYFAIRKGFDKLPFEKLKKIQININAPEHSDPGQSICLYRKCVDLAALLEHAKHGLPNMEINLLDSASAKWYSGNKPQHSISIDQKRHYPYYEFNGNGPCCTTAMWIAYRPDGDRPSDRLELDPFCEETKNTIEDDDIVLHAFLRLRNARSAKVSGSEQRRVDYYDNVAMSIEQEEPFGTYLDPGSWWHDPTLQEARDKLYMHLDLDLDLLPGPTANMMRLDRFSSWYTHTFGGESKYEENYKRIIESWVEYGFSSRRLWSLFRRFARMRAFNPKSMQRQYTEPQLSGMLAHVRVPDSIYHMNTREKVCELGLADDDWDQDAWHEAWPLEIPGFDAIECSAAWHQGHDFGRSKHNINFDHRIREWLQDEEDGRPAQRYRDKSTHWQYASFDFLLYELRLYEYLPYDLNHPPVDPKATHGIRTDTHANQ